VRTCVMLTFALLAALGCERPQAPGPDKVDGNAEKAGKDVGPAPVRADLSVENDRTAAAPISKDKWNLDHAEKTGASS
jgi:hypothetical protein